MVSLQVFVGQHRDIGIQKQRRKTIEHPKKPLRKVSKIGVDFGPEGGVGLSFFFFWGGGGGREKGLKNSGDFGTEFATEVVPVSGKIRDRIQASSLYASSFRDCVLSSWTERPSKTPPVRRERVG